MAAAFMTGLRKPQQSTGQLKGVASVSQFWCVGTLYGRKGSPVPSVVQVNESLEPHRIAQNPQRVPPNKKSNRQQAVRFGAKAQSRLGIADDA